MTLTDEQRAELLDDDGENLAVRMFLMMYGGQTCTTQGMRRHLELAGFPYWPEWANADFHLTKGGAQLWIRYLIGLESAQPESKPATLSEEQWKAINKAWYAIGADIAGLDWLRFSALIAAEVKGKGE